MQNPPQDTPLPADFICRKFAISRTTLWRWRRAGLPAQGVGAKLFIRESAVAAFIEQMNGQTVPATNTQGAEKKGTNP